MSRWRMSWAVVALLASCGAAAGSDWLQWRGPLGTGHAIEPVGAPTEWSQEKNIVWKVRLPSQGNSTPIVVAGRVLVTSASEGGKTRSLLCFDRRTGEELWRRDVAFNGQEATHNTNPHGAASPVSDGRRVFVWHGSAGFFAYDLEGKELWRRDLGRFDHIWGYAASPVIEGDLVILSAGPGLRAFVLAMNADNGADVWRFEPAESISSKVDEFRGSWSTPVIADINGRRQALLSLPQRLYSLDPASGEVIWSCGGLGDLVYTSPLVGEGFVVAMSGYHGPSLAVRTDGAEGDITETHRLWWQDKRPDNPQRVGSGIVIGAHVYIYNEPGQMWCLDAKTGERLWQERVGGKSWCSPVLVDGKLFINNEEGTTFVIEPDPTACRVVATNALGELMRASLAFSDGQVFARTYQHLYCIDQK